jgi:uncharacterized protein
MSASLTWWSSSPTAGPGSSSRTGRMRPARESRLPPQERASSVWPAPRRHKLLLAMKYVLFYESAADAAATAPLHFRAHKALWSGYAESGRLLLIGPFSDGSGAMAVFTTREAAEEFAKLDPFVVHGVVRSWSVKEWHEALVQED